METTFTIISFLFIGIIIVLPILLLIYFKKKKTKKCFLVYIFSSIAIVGLLTIIMAWWSHRSDMMLLSYRGYDIDGMSDSERYENIAQENMETVKSLETSIMGIGWPLKAIFGFTYVFFYPFIVFFGDKLISNLKKNMT